jgi:outer membrane protein
MKYLLSIVVLLTSFPAFSVTVGVVDMQRVINGIKQGKAIIKTLEKSFNKKKKELKKEEEKIIKMRDDFKKQSLVLSDKAKVKKEQELQMRIVELQKKTVDSQRQIQKQEAELKKPILEKLRKIVEEVSKKEKVDITIEVASPIIYAKDRKDITDAIIKAYDKKHGK